jgi:hypothetical protein
VANITSSEKITLSFTQRQLLRLLAERGGRTDYQFGKVFLKGDETKEAADKLAETCKGADEAVRAMSITPLTLITITPIIGSQRNELCLTDRGRQVVDQMGLVVKPISLHVDMKTGKEIKQ